MVRTGEYAVGEEHFDSEYEEEFKELCLSALDFIEEHRGTTNTELHSAIMAAIYELKGCVNLYQVHPAAAALLCSIEFFLTESISESILIGGTHN